MNLITTEWEDPLWEDNRVHRSCQVQSRQTCLWKQDRLSKLCMQDSWLQLKSDSISWRKTLTNSHNSQVQWRVVSTPCQETKILSEPKGWMRGNTKIGPVLEVTTCCLQGKYGVEIRIKSVNKDDFHSWVRISHGKDQDDNEQETSEMQFEEYALKLNAGDFASRSKAKSKPQRRVSASSSTKTIPIGERSWTDIEPETYSSIAYPVSKQLSTLLRQGHLPREEDGAIEFWRLGDYLPTNARTLSIGLMKCGRVQWQKAEATRKDFNIVLIHQDKKFFISELFKVIQDAIPLILHCGTMCWFWTISLSTFIIFDVQSICTPSQIQDWYWEDKIWARKDRQYSLRLWILWTKNTEIRTRLTWPHHVMHGTSRKRGRGTKTRCIGSIYSLLNGKDWGSIKQDRMQSSFTAHSHLIVSRK